MAREGWGGRPCWERPLAKGEKERLVDTIGPRAPGNIYVWIIWPSSLWWKTLRPSLGASPAYSGFNLEKRTGLTLEAPHPSTSHPSKRMYVLGLRSLRASVNRGRGGGGPVK